MKVYRVGHSVALDVGFPSGPYTCRGVPSADVARMWGMASAHMGGTHPSPYADSLLGGISAAERCAFDSIDALNRWFDGFGDALADAGFEVWTYEVPDWAVRVGRYGQAVFVANEAVEIERHAFKPEQTALFA